MANVSISGRASGVSERKLQITEFQGIDQSRGLYSGNYATSPDAVNFVVRNGVLRTAGGVAQYGPTLTYTTQTYTPASKPRLFQTYYQDASGEPIAKLIASFNRKLYAYNATTNAWSIVGTVTADGCDLVSYRHEDNEWAILTDGGGEMFYWDGTAAGFIEINPTQGGTAVKFQQIALLYERLWGGVFKDTPDRIYWSKAFEPDDWEFDEAIADDNGGFADIATFDGSKIRAIIPAFDDVLIFKDHTIHRLSGTYPGEFQISQVYGTSGTISPRTIVNTGSKLFFLSSDGLCSYDGMTVAPLKSFGDYKLKDIWALINHSVLDKACAAFYNNVIYLAVCLDTDESANTHVIEYDVVTNFYSIVEAPGIDDWLVLKEGQKETLLCIAWDKVYRYDSGATMFGDAIDAEWTSPEISLGTMSSKKVTGYVYLTAEASTLDVEAAPRMKISMISGEKTTAKVIPLKVGVNVIRKRVKVRGRTFRFKFENMDGNPLTIHRGVEIMVEEDAD